MTERADFTDRELACYLDEALDAAATRAIETALRSDPALLERLRQLNESRLAQHSLGAIWQRNRLSCPDEATLGGYALGGLEEAEADYIRFHLESVGCRLCQAAYADITRSAAGGRDRVARRDRMFRDSVGLLRRST